MRMMRGFRLDAPSSPTGGRGRRGRRGGEEDDDSVHRVWMVKVDGSEGKGLVVWYSGDDLGCIASRMPHLDYNIGHRFTRIWRYSVADQRYLGIRAHQAIPAAR